MPKGIPKTTVPGCASEGMKPKRGRGHPRAIIDWKKVDSLLMAGASGVQIAAVLGVHVDTLYCAVQREKKMSYSQYSQEKYEKGNAQLLGIQYAMAMEKDRTMAVWLGKNRLGQADKYESKVETNQIHTQKRILALPDNGRRTPTDHE